MQILWKRFIDSIKIVVLFLFCISLLDANPLQKAIDNAPSGATIKLTKAKYIGNLIINKPLTILGKEDGVIIDGDNNGTVITINSSHVTLKNLTIINSGSLMYKLNSAIKINKARYCEINSCKILNSLYGIDMVMVKDSLIINNYITSKKQTIPLRGDAMKIWYSNNNIFKNNIIDSSRDVTLTYSNNNLITNNIFKNSRFALHVSLSHGNIIKNNSFKFNSVALMIGGAKNTKLINNSINSSNGAAGIGVMIQGGSNFLLKDNNISYNVQGLYIDSKASEEGMRRYIKGNNITFNKEAIHFHSIIKNNTIVDNKIYSNIEDIVKSARGQKTRANIIKYNSWDRYTGFDRDNDNIGDTTHKVYQYADQLWHYNHKIKFFYASPIMSMLNFLSQLAPFVEPVFLLEDTHPIVKIR